MNSGIRKDPDHTVVVLHSYSDMGQEGSYFRNYMDGRFRHHGMHVSIHHIYLDLIHKESPFVDENGNERTLLIKGRHDPVVVPRAVVVVECMCALTVLDAMLANMTSRADSVRAFYNARK